MGNQANKDAQETRDLQDFQGQMVTKVNEVMMAHQALRDLPVPRVRKEIVDSQVCQASEVKEVHRELRVHQ